MLKMSEKKICKLAFQSLNCLQGTVNYDTCQIKRLLARLIELFKLKIVFEKEKINILIANVFLLHSIAKKIKK